MNSRSSEPDAGRRKKMLRGTLLVGFCTLLSRLLGMLRDIATAATLGMSVGGIMDSFVVAFRLPDMARKLFGDGSLSVSFIPVFSRVWQNDRQRAWTLLSVMLGWSFLILTALVLVGEGLCWIGFTFFSPESKVYLISHLMALMLPYLILISLAAITAATLQTLGKFAVPAMIPSILNIVWLFGILVIAPSFSESPAMQCYLLTVCILVAGGIQLFVGFPLLKKAGFQFDFRYKIVRPEIALIFSRFFPQLFGLMSIQLNLLTASVLAWLFSGPAEGTIRWLGNIVPFPLRSGSASAIYYSERLFEFPQGMIGLTIATVIYPLLGRHAARRDFKSFGDDLSLGMRIQLVFSIPAGVGLMLMADRLAHLLFQRGAFTPLDTFRTGDMIFWFGCGVWAFCSLPIIIRAFYVLGDIRTPCRIGILGCLVNFLLGFLLIWPMREEGLALAISLTSAIQSLLLYGLFMLKHGHVDFKGIVICALRSCAATFFMALAVIMVMKAIPGHDSVSDIIHIAVGGGVGVFVYFILHRAFGGRELGILVRGRLRKTKRKKKTARRKKT